MRFARLISVLLLSLCALAQVTPPPPPPVPPIPAPDVEPEHRGDAHDIVRFGESIHITPGDRASDVVCFGCSVTVNGRVSGDIAVFGGSLDVDERVDGDIVVFGGPANFHDNARVERDVAVIGGSMNVSPNAQVTGEIANPVGGGVGLLMLFFLVPLTIGVVLAIVLSLICYAIVGQRRLETAARTLDSRPGLSFAVGVGVFFAFALAFFAARHLRPIGGLIQFAVFGLLVLLAAFGYTALSLLLGRKAHANTPLSAVIIGALIIAVLQAVPFLQLIFMFAFAALGTGAAALSGFGTETNWLDRRT